MLTDQEEAPRCPDCNDQLQRQVLSSPADPYPGFPAGETWVANVCPQDCYNSGPMHEIQPGEPGYTALVAYMAGNEDDICDEHGAVDCPDC